jgi:hypothetical protein
VNQVKNLKSEKVEESKSGKVEELRDPALGTLEWSLEGVAAVVA